MSTSTVQLRNAYITCADDDNLSKDIFVPWHKTAYLTTIVLRCFADGATSREPSPAEFYKKANVQDVNSAHIHALRLHCSWDDS